MFFGDKCDEASFIKAIKISFTLESEYITTAIIINLYEILLVKSIFKISTVTYKKNTNDNCV